MSITIVSVGKIKEKYLNMAIDEYAKRLTKYTKLNFIQVQDEKTPDNASDAINEKIKQIEGERILKNIKESAYVIALAIEGNQLTSEKLASTLDNLSISGKSDIVFVIGGSLGLSKEVLNRANYLLSFSKMTFPHQLMKVILLEQIYRSYRIIKNEPYHK